jgi:hypothetical protein
MLPSDSPPQKGCSYLIDLSIARASGYDFCDEKSTLHHTHDAHRRLAIGATFGLATTNAFSRSKGFRVNRPSRHTLVKSISSDFARDSCRKLSIPAAEVAERESGFRPLKVYKYVDKASIPIFVACAVATFNEGDLERGHQALRICRRSKYFVVVLSDVLVSSVNDSTDTTDNQGNLLETVISTLQRSSGPYRPTDRTAHPERRSRAAST